MDISGQVEVTTRSGMKMTLEAAGEDRAGNQLWRQTGSSLESWRERERANVQRLKQIDP